MAANTFIILCTSRGIPVSQFMTRSRANAPALVLWDGVPFLLDTEATMARRERGAHQIGAVYRALPEEMFMVRHGTSEPFRDWQRMAKEPPLRDAAQMMQVLNEWAARSLKDEGGQ